MRQLQKGRVGDAVVTRVSLKLTAGKHRPDALLKLFQISALKASLGVLSKFAVAMRSEYGKLSKRFAMPGLVEYMLHTVDSPKDCIEDCCAGISCLGY